MDSIIISLPAHIIPARGHRPARGGRDARILTPVFTLPQVAETITPRPMDVAGEFLLYDESRTRVYLANAQCEERSALRLLLLI